MIKIYSEIKDEILGSPKKFFLPTKSFGCQRKSFRYRPKENFEPCPKSEGHIFTELCHFPWNLFILKNARNIQIEIKEEISDSPKNIFIPTKSCGCQGKSLRYRLKENFDTCLRSVGLIFSEIWPFSWKPTFCASNLNAIFDNSEPFLSWFKMNWSHGKWHNSVNMCPSDLGQGSKFSLGRYLKLFLWHPKDLVSRKIVLGEQKLFEKVCFFLLTL